MSDPQVTPDDAALAADVLADLAQEPMGLYEVLLTANTLFPGAPMSTRVAASERVIRRLVADERVRVWRGRWVGPEHARDSVGDDALEDVLLSRQRGGRKAGKAVVWMELFLDET